MKSISLALGLLSLAFSGPLFAQGEAGAFKAGSYGIYRMHAHHMAGTVHSSVLQQLRGQLGVLPKDSLSGHVGLIQRETRASRKWLNSIPEERLQNEAAAPHVKAIREAHTTTLESTKAIQAELEKPEPNYEVVSEHVGRIAEAMKSGEDHIHQAHFGWQLKPVIRRLHPGT